MVITFFNKAHEMFPFYDRKTELAALRSYAAEVEHDCSRLVVLTGRRRIGKTTLANRAFAAGKLPYLFFFVSAEKTEAGNVAAFIRDNASALGLEGLPVTFRTFEEILEFVLKSSGSQPMILVMDEFQNCSRVAPAFMSDLQRLWDRYRKQTKLLLVLTGSVASAMKEIVDSPAAPLFGRKSGEIQLRAFSTDVIKEVFTDFAPRGTPDDLLTVYAIAGGIPKYLEVLAESGAVTKESAVAAALRPSSFFITEADVLFRTEFKSEYAVYFEILEKIARGKTRRSEIASAMAPQEINGQLMRLEVFYRLIERVRPLGSTKATDFRYRIADDYVLFWFRFIYPNQGIIQQGATERLLSKILQELPDYTGRHILESWFRKKLTETGLYAFVGPWWDRRGENEIDIVAVNNFDKEILFAEVKRDAGKISLALLKEKVHAFLQQNKEYRHYKARYEGWSLADL